MADDFRYHIDHHGSLVTAGRATVPPGPLANPKRSPPPRRRPSIAAAARAAPAGHVGGRGRAVPARALRIRGVRPRRGLRPGRRAAAARRCRGDCRRPAARSAPAAPAATGRLADAEAATPLASVERPVFVVLPSPGYLAAVGSALADREAIDAADASAQALAAILRAEIEALASQGVAYVALGNPLYPPLLTVAGRERLAGDVDVDAVLNAAGRGRPGRGDPARRDARELPRRA